MRTTGQPGVLRKLFPQSDLRHAHRRARPCGGRTLQRKALVPAIPLFATGSHVLSPKKMNDLETLAVYRRLSGALAKLAGLHSSSPSSGSKPTGGTLGARAAAAVPPVYSGDEMLGILPLVVRRETTRAGKVAGAHLSAARLGHFLRSHRPQSGRSVGRRPAAHRPHSQGLGSARSALDRPRANRPRPQSGSPLFAGLPSTAGVWTGVGRGRNRRDLGVVLGGSEAEASREHSPGRAAVDQAGSG